MNSVSDVFNAVLVDGDATDEVMFFGKGAGKLATASAVVADAPDCAEHKDLRRPIFWGPEKPELIADYRTVENQYYIRLKNVDKTAALAAFPGSKIIDGASDVSFITGKITESAAVEIIKSLGADLCAMIRVAKA